MLKALSEVHDINTRHKHDIHRPVANLTVYQKVETSGIYVHTYLLDILIL